MWIFGKSEFLCDNKLIITGISGGSPTPTDIMEEMARYTADPKMARSMAQNSGTMVTSLVAE